MKKKLVCILICLIMVLPLVLPVSAAPEGPVITLQPQNYHFESGNVAIYTVKATGTNLRATWYMEYNGTTYNISDNQNGMEPWEAYAGEHYGGGNPEPGVFTFFFEGIEEGLSGAKIWCVIEDGHYDVTSDYAIITIQGDTMPPEILQIPAAVSVSQGQAAEIRCIARSNSSGQLEFQWYETTTGKLQDIRAMDGETADYLFCNTNTPGTRYYVCLVTSTDGGMVYSSVVPVTVTDSSSAGGKEPTFLTTTLPQGTVGEDYGFILETDDHGAVFTVSYNPGGANDFEKTGLILTQEGMLAGKLTKAGTYTFTICVTNDYGDDYGVLTLTVVEPGEATDPTEPETTQDPTIEETDPTEITETGEETDPAETKETKKEKSKKDSDEEEGSILQWLLPIGIGVAAATAGVGVGVILIKRKK